MCSRRMEIGWIWHFSGAPLSLAYLAYVIVRYFPLTK